MKACGPFVREDTYLPFRNRENWKDRHSLRKPHAECPVLVASAKRREIWRQVLSAGLRVEYTPEMPVEPLSHKWSPIVWERTRDGRRGFSQCWVCGEVSVQFEEQRDPPSRSRLARWWSRKSPPVVECSDNGEGA